MAVDPCLVPVAEAPASSELKLIPLGLMQDFWLPTWPGI
jgi:hypothetical protein